MMTYDPEARRQYKRQAQRRIRENFWPTMAAVLLYMVPLYLTMLILRIGIGDLTELSNIQELMRIYQELTRIYKYIIICLILMLFVSEPLKFGLKQYFVGRARGQNVSVALVLSGFSSMKKYITSIQLALCIFVRSFGWMLLLTVCLVLAFIVQEFSVLLGNLVSVIVLVLSLVTSVKIRRYDGAYICMTDTPDASVWQAVRACVPIFKGHNWELFVFELSFILWNTFADITYGIAGIYVEAYHGMAFVNYFDGLCGKTTN